MPYTRNPPTGHADAPVDHDSGHWNSADPAAKIGSEGIEHHFGKETLAAMMPVVDKGAPDVSAYSW